MGKRQAQAANNSAIVKDAEVRAAKVTISLDEYKKLVIKLIGPKFLRDQRDLVVEYFADGKSVEQLKRDHSNLIED